jgi:hypothetical protein
MLSDVLASVMAYMQFAFPFKQLYNLYITYIPIKKKQTYINTE